MVAIRMKRLARCKPFSSIRNSIFFCELLNGDIGASNKRKIALESHTKVTNSVIIKFAIYNDNSYNVRYRFEMALNQLLSLIIIGVGPFNSVMHSKIMLLV